MITDKEAESISLKAKESLSEEDREQFKKYTVAVEDTKVIFEAQLKASRISNTLSAAIVVLFLFCLKSCN